MGTNDILGVCVVGAGEMGRIHTECWNMVKNIHLVSIVDIDEERAYHLCRDVGIPQWFTNYKDAIAHPEVHIVSICTPTEMHAEICIFAAELGKHVLCEKPIALTLPEAELMLNTVDKYCVKLMVGLMRRYSPITEKVKYWMNSNSLGHPIFAHAVSVMGVRPKKDMHDQNKNGGPLLDMFSHNIDMWRYLFDAKPQIVKASGMVMACQNITLANIKNKAIDTATVSITFDTGDIGTFVVSWGLPNGLGNVQQSETFYGQNGILELSFSRFKQQAIYTNHDGNIYTLTESSSNMYQLQIQNFVDCIRRDLPILTNGVESYENLKVLLAAISSIETELSITL
ncbi:MAG: Gfo/Idh/MocA family oxidoreductase [Calothrix sp. SM1_7_51]|nr:Gfo/Idh/MocA family oxidoreductase [Calothrix sp. SM1_7_51]